MTSSCRTLPVLTAVFLALLVTSASTSAAQSLNVVLTAVSSLSGCVDSYPTTLNCTFPASIAISTTGLGTLNISWTLLRISGPSSAMWATPTLAADGSTVLAILTARTYNPGLFNTLLNLSLYDYSTGNVSAPFPGISFAYDAPPMLSSISGCATGSGAGTFACVPATDVLTFTGRGFRWLPYSSMRVSNVSASSYYSTYSSLTVVNDSYALLPLNTTYAYVLLPQHYNGVVLPLSFSIASYNYSSYAYTYYLTNQLSISFVPLPAPIVYSISASSSCTNATGPAGQTVWINCRPQVSWLMIYGQYLYADSITVGGAVCPSPSSTGGYSFTANAPYVYCYLPLLPQYSPGQLLDVVVTNPAGSFYLNQSIAFTSQPTLVSLSSCIQGQVFGGYCVAGDALTITGSLFYNDPTMNVTLQSYNWRQQGVYNVTCDSPHYINSTAISCTLPALDAVSGQQFYGNYARVTASFNSSSIVTNTLYSLLYNYPDAPHITAVSGCDTSVSAVQSTSCHSGGILTISGYNLSGSSQWIGTYNSPSFECVVLSNSSSSITCQLPVFDAADSPLQADTPYTLLLYVVKGTDPYYYYWAPSNTFSIAFTFAPPLPPLPPSESSSSHAGLIAGVVIACLVVLAAAAAGVVLYRRRRAAAHQSLQEDGALGSAFSPSSVGYRSTV